ARGDALTSVVGVDWPHRFCRTRPHYIDERPMEADVESLVRAGVGTNRLENAGSPAHCFTPTWRDSVVRDTANISSWRRASHRLSRRRDRRIRSNRGAISAARPTYNGNARLAGSLLARRTSSSAAADPQKRAEIAQWCASRVSIFGRQLL